ncbi:hypothetical protein NKV53_11800 [Legionella sp. 27cVA30]|uniref:hypothetical protein n=1 Tax=Legionella sp. 27cVA30 TaxID=2905657 RepID=UPI00209E6608|nr:hypothetical protein [Legionella sp. 27cVA30]MCP0915000.1 hypothetical protein [Legionella sp. 27cVA30]
MSGKNSWAPQVIVTHRYFFKLYALDSMLSFDGQAVLNTMQNHILAESVLGSVDIYLNQRAVAAI